MILLLIVGEIMIIWYECCWVIFVMIIHALGVDKYVVVVELWYFCDFYKNGLKMEKFDFDEFEWIHDEVVLN